MDSGGQYAVLGLTLPDANTICKQLGYDSYSKYYVSGDL